MHKKFDILVVDDVLENLKLLIYILKDNAYNVRAVQNGEAAIKAISTKNPDLILLDINLPDMSGFDISSKLISSGIPIIFLSGNTDYNSKKRAFELGGVDYITKPFNDFEVLARVQTHLHLKQYREELEEKNKNLESQVINKMQEIYEAQLSTIFAISKLAESRDDDTGKHIERVSTYSKILAEFLLNSINNNYKIDEIFCKNIYYSSSLHDIGKIAIPDNVLLKTGKLDSREYEIIKTHTTIGANNLKEVLKMYPNNSFITMGVEIAQNHHEHWDGSGYPSGLKHEKIPLSARIVAIVDVYDALCSERVYKKALSHEDALSFIKEKSGIYFDPYLVDIFISHSNIFENIKV